MCERLDEGGRCNGFCEASAAGREQRRLYQRQQYALQQGREPRPYTRTERPFVERPLTGSGDVIVGTPVAPEIPTPRPSRTPVRRSDGWWDVYGCAVPQEALDRVHGEVIPRKIQNPERRAEVVAAMAAADFVLRFGLVIPKTALTPGGDVSARLLPEGLQELYRERHQRRSR